MIDKSNEIDDAIITMQALEALLHDLDDSANTTTMQVLAARVTNALVRVQISATATDEVAA